MYYIDGYNLLHKSAALRPLAQEDFEAAREGLIDQVAHFCMATGHQVTIVFDGLSRHEPEHVDHYRNVPGLKVLYAPKNRSADAVIERLVYGEPRRIEVVVVSTDRGLRDICTGMGALVMDADNFLTVAGDARREMDHNLQHRRKQTPEASIEERLDPGTVEALMKLRKKL